MSAPRFDRDDVVQQLRPAAVLDHFGVKARHSGGELRTHVCPVCGPRSREAVAVNAATGRWIDHAHGCRGDVLALLAGLAGLDIRRDIRRVLDLGASLASVEPTIHQHAVRQHDERTRVEADRREARYRAANEWRRLARVRRHEVGERYLRCRRLDPQILVEGDYVRFYANGDLAVPLWSMEDGEIVNVVRRVIAPTGDEPKVRGLRGCPTSGTLIGRVHEVERGYAMIVEGVADALTAVQLWPDRVILGAHGAGRVADVVRASAPRVRDRGAGLVLVPDGDDVGQRCALRATDIAIASGLVVGRDLHLIDVAPHHDLNEAHCAGWLP